MRLRVAERILKFTTEIRRLGQIIPICSWCGNIRNDNNYWQLIETYIAKQTGGRISHSMCPACVAKETSVEDGRT
jgi:sigma-B regulation protein RsbU (phosphoserine phosphatase)